MKRVRDSVRENCDTNQALLSSREADVHTEVENTELQDDHIPSTRMVGEVFHQHFETIIEWLKIPGPLIIGLYGMGGVGKTTLLKCIHNHLQSDSDVARCIYWVTVSHDCSMYKLQHKLLRVVTSLNDFDEDGEKRGEILREVLTKMGKIVIILDDLWDPFMLDQIGIPLRDSNCKVVVSARSLEVCRRIGCSDFTIEMKPLSTNEAWDLFVDRLQNYEALAPEVKPLAKSVSEECNCLPLAVVTIASSMRGVFGMSEWEYALNELRNDANHDMFGKLKFCYDHVNDELLQTCLLSCVLYPKDTDIDTNELIELWIGEGFLKPERSWVEQMNSGHTIINKLVNSGLLERPIDPMFDKMYVKMNDRIREMGIIITQSHPRFMAKSGLLLNEAPPEDQWNENLVKVSLRENDISDITMANPPTCSKLSVLILCRNPLKGIPESFLAHMKGVTVLDLSYTLIQMLPDSVCNLENLRALFLCCCEELIYVPSLSNLTKLTILDLAFCRNLREAPRGMEHLKRLTKLNCLWNLDDLTYFHMLQDCRCLNELNSYEFWIHGSSNMVPYCIEQDCLDSSWDFDKRVIISGEAVGLTLSTILLPVTTRFLSFMDCDMNRNGTTLGDMMPSLNRVTELKSLKISCCAGLEYISSERDKLGALECVNLWRCHDLKSLIRFPGTYSQLQNLRIQECHNLKVVFGFELLQHQPCFPNLEDVSVIICDEIEEIFEANSLNDISLILKLPKLRRLTIGYLPKLRGIYKGLISTPLQSYVRIGDLPNFGGIHRGTCLFWDDSVFGLVFDSNARIWDVLFRDYPEDAVVLSSWVNRQCYSSWVEWLSGVEEDC